MFVGLSRYQLAQQIAKKRHGWYFILKHWTTYCSQYENTDQSNEAVNSKSGHFRHVSNKQWSVVWKPWNTLITEPISWARRGIELSTEHILKLSSSAEKLGLQAQAQLSLPALLWVSELVPWHNSALQEDTPTTWALARGYLQSQHMEIFPVFIIDPREILSVLSSHYHVPHHAIASLCFFLETTPHMNPTHFLAVYSSWQAISLTGSLSIQNTIADFSERYDAYRTKIKICA